MFFVYLFLHAISSAEIHHFYSITSEVKQHKSSTEYPITRLQPSLVRLTQDPARQSSKRETFHIVVFPRKQVEYITVFIIHHGDIWNALSLKGL